jgi:hypothetical protein
MYVCMYVCMYACMCLSAEQRRSTSPILTKVCDNLLQYEYQCRAQFKQRALTGSNPIILFSFQKRERDRERESPKIVWVARCALRQDKTSAETIHIKSEIIA